MSRGKPKKKRLRLWIFIGLVIILAAGLRYGPLVTALMSIQPGVEQAGESPDSELGRLIRVMDAFKEGGMAVIFDGKTYSLDWGWRRGRLYLAQNSENIADAAEWIKKHTYRSDEGNVIYFQYPDGSQVPMRDVFLEKLASLEGR